MSSRASGVKQFLVTLVGRVTLVKNPVLSLECGKDGIVIKSNGQKKRNVLYFINDMLYFTC